MTLEFVPDKWRLALKVAPVVVVTTAAKLMLDWLGWEGLSVNPLYTSLVAATVFLLGFLLAGTLADYKESERLPGELAASLETIADECAILHQSKQAPEARACLAHLQGLTRSLRGWFYEKERTSAVLEGITGLNRFFLAFEPLTQPNFIVRLKQEQSTIRRIVTRIHMIRETSFVAAGYAIAELSTAALVIALLATDLAPLGGELVLLSITAFLLVYMIVLIRDLDDPFDYAEGKGMAEVSLHPLEHLDERLTRSLAEAGVPAEARAGT